MRPAAVSVGPIVVVGCPALAARIEQLLPAARASGSALASSSISGGRDRCESSNGLPAAVIRVPSFLSALGEAARHDLSAVLGPVAGLSGMAASTAESLRKLAPRARLILLESAAATDRDDAQARLALDAGFDHTLPADPDLTALARALELPLPTPDRSAPAPVPAPAPGRTTVVRDVADFPRPAGEPVLRQADPTDLSTLELTPAGPAEFSVVDPDGADADPVAAIAQQPQPAADSATPRRGVGAPPATAALHDAAHPPPYQATLDAALPAAFHDPPTPPGSDLADPTDPADADHPDADLGDTDLVNLVLRGDGGLLPLALRMIRHQAHLPHLEFTPPDQEVPPGHLEAPVAQDTHHFGTLHLPPPEPTPPDHTPPDHTPPAEFASAAVSAPQPPDPTTLQALTAWADWLVHWLRLEAQFNRLRDLAMKDELTGAWNRRYFNHFLRKILDRAAHDRQQVTLLVFDIDDFKLYNDAYGHPAGDEILQGVARLMMSTVREHDVVARIGGDEFAVIFWDAGQQPRKAHSKHPDDVLNAAKRFQKAVLDHRFPKLLDKAAGTLTISGGLAGFPWDGRTPEELLTAADTMAMQSKKLGKNAITFGPGARGDLQTP